MNTRAVASEYRLAQWTQTMQERLAEGRNITEFCKERGISKNTHAAYDKNYDNDNFSPADKNNAHTRGVNNYIVTPGGYLKKYDINKKKVTTITNMMPYDPLHPKKK